MLTDNLTVEVSGEVVVITHLGCTTRKVLAHSVSFFQYVVGPFPSSLNIVEKVSLSVFYGMS